MPVDTTHPEYDKYSAKWKRCRDASCGQDAVHAAGTQYLPRLGGQEDGEYKAYKMRAYYYGATGRTIDGMSGMLFRKEPDVTVPTVLEPFLEDVTRDNLTFQNFAEQAAEELLQVGRAGILVDHPPGIAVMTQAAAAANRLRPYMRLYKAESIINWKTTDGTLTMVVLCEMADEEVDEFKSESVKQWRVLDMLENRYRQRIFQKSKEKTDEFVQIGGDIFPMMNGASMSYIPFIFCGARDCSPGITEPPLMPLVETNLSHYRTSADYENGLHWCGAPTPWTAGFTPEQGQRLTIGSGAAWMFPNADTKVGLLEMTADSIGALEIAMQRKEGQMAALGARMLSPDKKMVESADAAAIHRGGESSVLASLAMSLSSALKSALMIMGEWLRSSEDVFVDINRDYLPTGLSAQELTALVQAWQSGAISHESLYDALVAGEVIQDKEGYESEKERIEETPPGMVTMNDG